MILSSGRFVAVIAALSFLGCSAASACTPGDIQCDKGYRFECQCWTDGKGCRYFPSGTCYHDDPGGVTAANLNLLIKKYIRQARLVCTGPGATDASQCALSAVTITKPQSKD